MATRESDIVQLLEHQNLRFVACFLPFDLEAEGQCSLGWRQQLKEVRQNIRRITLQLEVRNITNNKVCITKVESDGLIVIGGKWSGVIAEERDALKVAATAGSLISSEPLVEELEWLRQERTALEQASQDEKAKWPVQASAPAPDTSDLESRLVGCFSYATDTFFQQGLIGCSYPGTRPASCRKRRHG